ncbi:hypothetical protein HP398_08825 [Brevibacillus sp. HB1.4B]|uniref:hypothetical protein n=1 Tax=Brevibacillus TaxID=55080 RepID=UPI00036CF37B|nr:MULTISPECIES: hypothetical protein [unclassified Brevibacillus]NRS16535.1 hypothetical protein [Brevibacillus sp. HB1.4B]NTU34251.1 hypothetical protein [Brevibacillus sp. HB1.1]
MLDCTKIKTFTSYSCWYGIDGTNTIFEDYQIVVETMQQWQLHQMPEFNGY